MLRRSFLKSIVYLTSLTSFLSCSTRYKGSEQGKRDLKRIAFGSCAKASLPQNIWKSILSQNPDVFLFLGDTVYTEKKDVVEKGEIYALNQAYQKLSNSFEFNYFRSKTNIHAVWDDNDYGVHDEFGKNFEGKEIARKMFLDFWREPEDSPRRHQLGGIYTSYYYGDIHERVQIIVLDTRYSRSALLKATGVKLQEQKRKGFGPYLINNDIDAAILHQSQWSWLEKELLKPAKLRLICTSIPFSVAYRGWETWSNFPNEKKKMFEVIQRTKANGIIFLSGDMHYADLSCETDGAPYPLWDLTSSGLTHFWHTATENKNRVSKTYHGKNFALLDLQLKNGRSLVNLCIKDEEGESKALNNIDLNTLKVI